ncbi:MAG: hypothetical protein HQK54_16770, partial [Oligoflexales bacterium]|nr:hypothetical protein [Oligoflexales bacterium]
MNYKAHFGICTLIVLSSCQPRQEKTSVIHSDEIRSEKSGLRSRTFIGSIRDKMIGINISTPRVLSGEIKESKGDINVNQNVSMKLASLGSSSGKGLGRGIDTIPNLSGSVSDIFIQPISDHVSFPPTPRTVATQLFS